MSWRTEMFAYGSCGYSTLMDKRISLKMVHSCVFWPEVKLLHRWANATTVMVCWCVRIKLKLKKTQNNQNPQFNMFWNKVFVRKADPFIVLCLIWGVERRRTFLGEKTQQPICFYCQIWKKKKKEKRREQLS